MSRRGSTTDPSGIGDRLTRLGLGVLAVAVPLFVAAAIGLVATAEAPGETPTLAAAAIDGPVVGGSGLPWFLRLGWLGLLCGCWLVGAGLLVDGLSD